MIVLAAVILAGLGVLGVPGWLGGGVRDLLCRIVEQRHCADRPGRGAVKRNPQTPARCLRTQSSSAVDHNIKIIAYRRNHDKTTLVQRNSDGSISETVSGQGGNGVDIYGGFDGKGGKKTPDAGAKIGGNGLDISKYSTRLDFPGNRRLHLTPDQQRARYNSLVAARRRQMAVELSKDPERSSDPSFQNRRNSIPVDAARELGVHTTVFNGSGGSSTDGLDSTLGVAGLDGTATKEQIHGTSVDDNGTVDKRDDVTTVMFTDTNTLKGDVTISVDPFPKGRFGSKYLRGTGGFAGEYSPVTGYEIKYQAGRPISISLNRQLLRTWGQINGGGATGRNASGKSGEQDTGGVVRSQMISVDLKRHPEVYAAFRDYLRKKERATRITHPGIFSHVKSIRQVRAAEAPARAAAKKLNDLLSRQGQFSQVDYDRMVRKDGPELSVSRWIQLAAAEWTTTNDNWSVKDARFYDPVQGRWVPWTECVQGTSPQAGGH